LPGPDSIAPALDRILQERQADRLPSVAAAVVRKGEIVWANAVGSASYDEGRDATPDTQYRIGSITKTFTATAVMQLRDEGKLDLDDRLEQHLEGVANGSPTIRRMLAHLSGLQREPGDMWITGESPTAEELVESMRDVEFVLKPAQSHHYSNLAFALLGEVVARRSGVPYVEYVSERIIGPLSLARTTWSPQEPVAQGYLVDDYAGTVWREEQTDMRGTAAAGALWSTVEDLCRWVSFLAEGRDGVLTPDTVEEMWFPTVMYFPDNWVLAWGLGLMLANQDGRIWGGHGGAMAGHLAGAYVDRKSKTGAAVLVNSGTRADADATAIKLAAKALELWPEDVEPWRPEEAPPDDVRPLLGRWWSEGNEFTFWWEQGALRARPSRLPSTRPPAVFERVGEGEWRAVSGYERGERLRLDGDRLTWSGYAFTRAQEPFTKQG
jgi:CubicO group peptidase (beta-lactamase class C family)